MVPKYFLLIAALLWTGIVAYFCLVQSSDLPTVNIPNLDKCIHAFFHFVFTFLWFLFFYKQLKSDSIFRPLLISFLFSFVFGAGIEILQGIITTTRSADVLDAVANLVGAAMSVFTVVICYKNNVLNIVLKN
ncbi:VanZ like protein [Flavobacterium aquicola]|uniref:VanZ like protein n=1 Tax=Flavobacterium aquicola TaxID=1682742 RepID=A0A3E0EQ23_9FLAO|nr:VanZ like protein [Flavobacterium aquicola]